jgi:hypothetical protein
MSETQAEKEARWKREDDAAFAGARTGNPFATLCQHCYGRHPAPRDKECPYSPPTPSRRSVTMTERSWFFSQTWSARKRPDGTLEPDCPIGAVGIAPAPDDELITPSVIRHMMTHFGKLGPGEPFFMVRGQFVLVPAEIGHGEEQPR